MYIHTYAHRDLSSCWCIHLFCICAPCFEYVQMNICRYTHVYVYTYIDLYTYTHCEPHRSDVDHAGSLRFWKCPMQDSTFNSVFQLFEASVDTTQLHGGFGFRLWAGNPGSAASSTLMSHLLCRNYTIFISSTFIWVPQLRLPRRHFKLSDVGNSGVNMRA